MASRKRSHDDDNYKDDDESSLESNDSDASNDYARTGSNTMMPSKPGRQERRRESNRLSKRRCRKQRKEMVMTLEIQIRRLAQEQKDLKAENDELRKELLESVLELQKPPEENAQEGAQLPASPGKIKTAENHLSTHGTPHEISVKHSPSLGLMVPSPSLEGSQDVSYFSQSLNVAGINAYQGPSGLVPSISGAQNYRNAAIPGDTSNGLNFLDMISLLTKNSSVVQNPGFSLGHLPTAQAANQPSADPLIAASQNVLPFMSFSNPRYDSGMAWMARFASAHNAGDLESILNQNTASRPTLTFPPDDRAGPYFSASEFCQLPQGQQDADQKWPARK